MLDATTREILNIVNPELILLDNCDESIVGITIDAKHVVYNLDEIINNDETFYNEDEAMKFLEHNLTETDMDEYKPIVVEDDIGDLIAIDDNEDYKPKVFDDIFETSITGADMSSGIIIYSFDKMIECYMKHNKCSTEAAEEYIRDNILPLKEDDPIIYIEI